MDKKTLLAITLSVSIMLVYSWYTAKFYPQQVSAVRPAPFSSTAQKLPSEKTPEIESGVSSAGGTQIVESRLAEEKEINFENAIFKAVVSDRGGVIKRIYLPAYKQKGKGDYLLLEVKDPAEGIFSISGLDKHIPLENMPFRVKKEGNIVIFNYERPEAFTITKKLTFHNDNYIIELDIILKNLSDRVMKRDYSIVTASRIDRSQPIEERYIEARSLIDNIVTRGTLGQLKSEKLVKTGKVTWNALKNKYFTISLIPKVDTEGVFYKALQKRELQTGILVAPFNIEPYASVEHKFLLYAGPNSAKDMSAGGLNFNNVVSFGIFGGISSFLISALKVFYNITHNYGVAVILLTILVSFCLFPLTRKSFSSMKKMQELQPHINKLRKEYKDNPQKLNKEIMELYKKYKVNPLGGCLPVLLQMPIFIALYQGLTRSIELKGAGFLWIKDLSMPDRIFEFKNSFPVVGNAVNLLPILMAAIMFFQQKLTTKVPQEDKEHAQQQQMMAMMPLLFGIIFYNLPSGLVLYWLTNTILTTAYQWKLKTSV